CARRRRCHTNRPPGVAARDTPGATQRVGTDRRVRPREDVMVHTVVTAAPKRIRGSTLLGFMIGLIAGLSIAVVVAIFVTRAPVPFVNKANRAPERVIEPKSQAEAPDPNA